MASFRVQGYVEIKARGTFLMGQIEEGTLRIGDSVETTPPLTIAAIESADKISTRESWVCLRFAENPSKSELEERFPVGAAVRVCG
jgi:hypothetical protein